MKIRNDLGMPDHAFKAICKLQQRSAAPELDYIGVGSLLGAPLTRFLFTRYFDDIEFSVADTMNAIQGQLGHLLFDKVESRTMTEVSLEASMDGFLIRGRLDYYDPDTLTIGDTKFRQVNSVLARNIAKDDYLERQLNVYRWLAHQNGMIAEQLQGDIYINGWVRYKAYDSFNYPKAPYVKIKVPLWNMEFAESFIRERLAAHDLPAIRLLRDIRKGFETGPAAMKRLDALMLDIPICTEKERFTAKSKWAVMKEGQKKAVKLFESREDAVASGLISSVKHSLVERKGGNIKCMYYCDVKPFCPYKKIVDNKEAVE